MSIPSRVWRPFHICSFRGQPPISFNLISCSLLPISQPRTELASPSCLRSFLLLFFDPFNFWSLLFPLISQSVSQPSLGLSLLAALSFRGLAAKWLICLLPVTSIRHGHTANYNDAPTLVAVATSVSEARITIHQAISRQRRFATCRRASCLARMGRSATAGCGGCCCYITCGNSTDCKQGTPKISFSFAALPPIFFL